MADTFSTVVSALKERWTEDEVVSQLVGRDKKFWSKLPIKTEYAHGEYSVTPIGTHYPGGYTPVGHDETSAALNAAGNVGVNQAQWTHKRHWQQVAIDEGVFASTGSLAQSVLKADDIFKAAIESLWVQLSRQAFSDATAQIVACATTTAANDVVLATVKGKQVLKRRWLHKGQTIDIGTAASEASVAGDRTITAVAPTTPTITISGAAVTTASTDFVSIANARVGTTTIREMNGLDNIISTSTLGGLSSATEAEWQPGDGAIDATTTALSLPALDNVAVAVYQTRDDMASYCATSWKQWMRFREMLQVQVRFNPSELKYGDEKLEYGGMIVQPHYHCLDDKWYFVNFEDLFVVSPQSKPEWVNSITGDSARLQWKEDSTSFVTALRWPLNLAAKCRNRSGKLSTLTAT